jgi:DNA-binding NarL/FixJ family response regulator
LASLRIFVADPHETVRQVVAALLSSQPEWEICGQCGDGRDAVEQVAGLKPHLVVLALDLPTLNGLEVTRQIVQNNSAQNVIILLPDNPDPLVRQVYAAGARGYVLTGSAPRDLVRAIEALRQGRTYFTPRMAESILQEYLKSPQAETKISPREQQTLQGLARELSSSVDNPWTRRARAKRIRRNVLVTALVVITAGLGWYSYFRRPEQEVPLVNSWFVRAGLKPVVAPSYGGNPDAKVWVDLHTGLYYCSGDPLYRHTRDGRLARQSDAEVDHFEPALRKGCQ